MEELYSEMRKAKSDKATLRCAIVENTLAGNLKQSLYSAQCYLSAESIECQLRARIATRRAKALESLGTKIAGV